MFETRPYFFSFSSSSALTFDLSLSSYYWRGLTGFVDEEAEERKKADELNVFFWKINESVKRVAKKR